MTGLCGYPEDRVFEASSTIQTFDKYLPVMPHLMADDQIENTKEYTCYFSVKAPELEFKNDAMLTIYAEKIREGTLFVYQGTDVNNKTSLIKNAYGERMPMVEGAPV